MLGSTARQNCQHTGVGHVSDTDTYVSSTHSRRKNIFLIQLFYFYVECFFFISNETYIHHEKNAKQPLQVFMMVNTKNSETKQQKKKEKEKEKKLKGYF